MLLYFTDRKSSKGGPDLASVSVNSWVLNCSLKAHESFKVFIMQQHFYNCTKCLNANGENVSRALTIKNPKTHFNEHLWVVFDTGWKCAGFLQSLDDRFGVQVNHESLALSETPASVILPRPPRWRLPSEKEFFLRGGVV